MWATPPRGCPSGCGQWGQRARALSPLSMAAACPQPSPCPVLPPLGDRRIRDGWPCSVGTWRECRGATGRQRVDADQGASPEAAAAEGCWERYAARAWAQRCRRRVGASSSGSRSSHWWTRAAIITPGTERWLFRARQTAVTASASSTSWTLAKAVPHLDLRRRRGRAAAPGTAGFVIVVPERVGVVRGHLLVAGTAVVVASALAFGEDEFRDGVSLGLAGPAHGLQAGHLCRAEADVELPGTRHLEALPRDGIV